MDFNKLSLDEISSEVSKRKLEILDLENIACDKANEQYNHLIGKCVKLAATSRIKINKIEYFDPTYNSIHVECTSVYGGEYTMGRLEINPDDDHKIKLSELDELKFITEEEFNKFIFDALNDITKIYIKK